MNYWTNTTNANGASATMSHSHSSLPQQQQQHHHSLLSSKDYERTLLHPLTNNNSNGTITNTPRNGYSSYGVNLQIPSPHDDNAATTSNNLIQQQRFFPQSQSPHYQYQQTLPRLYQTNSNMVPPIIHDDINNSNNITYQNNNDKNNLLPMRLNSNNSVVGNSSLYNHHPTSNTAATNAAAAAASSSSSSPFLYHWRSQSQNGTSPSSISSPSSSSSSASSTANNNIQHSPLYQMSIQNQQPLYKVPFIATSVPSSSTTSSSSVNGTGHIKTQLPMLQHNQHRQNSYPPRSSVTTINGKNIVNVLNHNNILHHPHNQNIRLRTNGSLSHQHTTTNNFNNNSLNRRVEESNSMVHIHGCHLCEKSFKRKSWLKRHLLSHSAERHFLCPWCLSRHKRKDNLLQHMKLKHSTYLLDELKNHSVTFHWEKSTSTNHINNIHNIKLDQSNGPNCNNNNNNNIKTLLNEGVLNKEDVKRVLNKLIDQNNA
ncbi:similar to Saccharomyces cerevisiae YMR070W MOT3 Nuclear transcription factor with two Cys2-His2 zinc fingers [Maudiozyma saulgeensis]|uniref:Similar to Saccharomyces cerevisiae YMR070W MOT3 Nuclear transcription factor with two Cys2-His2 zinc fingers n=1 Tax=Maudiozyma saulgeensis TaxID=1789683 RepID=A0A1X7R874_9SACH|nr:similar to Saccharomyces cerevisiae YMR070W MOT3 Nuclear transcription factor with two Cys2-His2 zinc fingers [Kazachstania saulgeensis]